MHFSPSARYRVILEWNKRQNQRNNGQRAKVCQLCISSPFCPSTDDCLCLHFLPHLPPQFSLGEPKSEWTFINRRRCRRRRRRRSDNEDAIGLGFGFWFLEQDFPFLPRRSSSNKSRLEAPLERHLDEMSWCLCGVTLSRVTTTEKWGKFSLKWFMEMQSALRSIRTRLDSILRRVWVHLVGRWQMVAFRGLACVHNFCS